MTQPLFTEAEWDFGTLDRTLKAIEDIAERVMCDLQSFTSPLVGRSESEAIRVGGGACHEDRSPTRKTLRYAGVFRPPHKGEVK